MLDDAFAHGEREVQAAVRGVALLEVLDDAQGVEVVVEAEAVTLQAAVEGALAGVAEGRVADVVDEGEGFGEIFVEVQGGGDGAGDLRDLDGVGEARAEVVGGAGGEDLRLAGEAAEGAGLDDALAVALEGGADAGARARGSSRGGAVAGGAGRARFGAARWSLARRASTVEMLSAGAAGVRRQDFLLGWCRSLASLVRASSSLCLTLAMSAGSASAGREWAYSVMERSHWSTASLRRPVARRLRRGGRGCWRR